MQLMFFLWINNVYIYVWPCLLHAFDYIINHMKNHNLYILINHNLPNLFLLVGPKDFFSIFLEVLVIAIVFTIHKSTKDEISKYHINLGP
jgi:hypothetical protein